MATGSSQPGDAPVDASAGRRFTPGPRRGDLRRAALLDALEALLADRPLSDIGVADIANSAGVSRSAFYFYFPNAAAAVAACMSDFYVEMEDVGSDWLKGVGGPALQRVTTSLTAASALWRSRAGLLTAMLDAVGTDGEVREIW